MNVPCELFFYKFIYLFIYLFLAVLGLCFCATAFSSCGKRGLLFTAVCRPLTIAASLVAEHRLQMRRLSSCGSRAQLLRGMWDLPRPGLKPVSPALAGRFSTTAPPGKPSMWAWEECALCCCWMVYSKCQLDQTEWLFCSGHLYLYWSSACLIYQFLTEECWSLQLYKWIFLFFLSVLSVLPHVFWLVWFF